MTHRPFPPADEGLALHRRLLDGELAVTNEICERYLVPLSDWLATRHPPAHPDDCGTAAGDALWAYFKNPAKFDPAKGELSAYLRMAAERDLKNVRRKEARHRRRREPEFRVEESPVVGNSLQEEPLASSIRREEQEAARERLDAVRDGCTEPERAVLALLIDGERESIRYAAPLGIEELPEPERSRGVKRVQDRIKKRIYRKGEASDDPTREDG